MRLDQFLVQHKNIESRTKAQDLIVAQQISVNGKIILKPSYDVSLLDQVDVQSHQILKFVSRAGLKLESALLQLNLPLKDKVVLDVGQSTGGFSDCCLQHGAKQVVGFDVGENQLHQKLRSDPRIIFFEKLNVKNIQDNLDFMKACPDSGFNLMICDVSFISLTQVVPHVARFLKMNCEFLILVKPQFECGAANLDKNGIVKNKNIYARIEKEMTELFSQQFGEVISYFESAVPGKDGNLEFFIYGRRNK